MCFFSNMIKSSSPSFLTLFPENKGSMSVIVPNERTAGIVKEGAGSYGDHPGCYDPPNLYVSVYLERWNLTIAY